MQYCQIYVSFLRFLLINFKKLIKRSEKN